MEHLYYWNDFVSIPNGIYSVGSSKKNIMDSYNFWSSKLLDSYQCTEFYSWLEKEYPEHKIKTNNYKISKYPVTIGLFNQYLTETKSKETPLCFLNNEAIEWNNPVWGVSLNSVNLFCKWLSDKIKQKVRLPNEFEWEIAASGTSNYEYPYGNEFDPSKANSIESGIEKITPVDFFPNGSSEFGVFDMAGNVEEWTNSQYYPYPGGKVIKDDLFNTVGENYPILRGGSFIRGGDLTRCARRHGPFPSLLYQYIGFRVVI